MSIIDSLAFSLESRSFALIDASAGANRRILDAIKSASGVEVATVLDWIANHDSAVIAAHFSSRDKTLRNLDNILGIARLEGFVARGEQLLTSSKEGAWQELLKEESWALSQLLAKPGLPTSTTILLCDLNYTVNGHDSVRFIFG